jgi:hypothetical protein
MKTTIKTGLAAILLLAISCTKENNTIISSTVTQATGKALSFTIGQRYGGGIIFYIDSTGQHGLIADTVDRKPQETWYNGVYIATGATATRIGSGRANTHKIILSQGDSGHYAARRCWHYKQSGYSDWFLPSRDELYELYKQRDVVGGLKGGYFSSSEYGLYDWAVWGVYFNTGAQNYFGKYQHFHVRAIRAF